MAGIVELDVVKAYKSQEELLLRDKGTATEPMLGATADVVSSKEQLILEHVPLVKYHAFRMVGRQLPPSVEINDLINAGVLGLIDAANKFDPARGVKFKTYADVRIRGAMLDSLRRLDLAPQSLRKQGKDLRDATDRLENRLGPGTGSQEVSAEMGITLDEFHRLRDNLHGATLGTFCEAKGKSQVDYYPDSLANGPHLQFEKQELITLLAEAIDDLDAKDRLVVSLYYFEELTMQEIGVILGVNASRVSQIHSKAITQLRKRFNKSGH